MKLKALLLSFSLVAHTMTPADTHTEERFYFHFETDNHPTVFLDIPESLYKKIQTKCDEPFQASIKKQSEENRMMACWKRLKISKLYPISTRINEGAKVNLIHVGNKIERLKKKFSSFNDSTIIKFDYPKKFDEIITKNVSTCLEQYKNENLTDKSNNEFTTCIKDSLKETNLDVAQSDLEYKSTGTPTSIMKFLIREMSFNKVKHI